jgi:hypothetical protein
MDPEVTPEIEPPPVVGAPTDFATTWQEVMRDPRGFFAVMPEAGGLAEPMTFLAMCAGLDAAGTLIVTWSVGAAIGAFAGVIVGAFILAAALTLVTQQLFEGHQGFEPIFRVVAYGSAPAVAFWVPRLAAIPICYAWYLQVRGVERVQGFDPGRASLATAIAWAAVWVIGLGLCGAPLGYTAH